MVIGRFAPSITGAAHPGTLLAGLLCWLDSRAQGGRVILRLEDLDRSRLRSGQLESMVEALGWLGLEWDEVVVQSELLGQHEAALDTLAASGALYPCECSRKQWRARGRAAPDGGVAYDNCCRGRELPSGGWRVCEETLRVRLPDIVVALIDESGLDLGQRPAEEMGDPVVRRRDGGIAYHLAVVVDDGKALVNRVVRGRDLASSSATQHLLRELLDLPHPRYRHHFLLLENGDEKLAKLRASMPYQQLATGYSGEEFCGRLAQVAGLNAGGKPCAANELVADFDWSRVRVDDRLFS